MLERTRHREGRGPRPEAALSELSVSPLRSSKIKTLGAAVHPRGTRPALRGEREAAAQTNTM